MELAPDSCSEHFSLYTCHTRDCGGAPTKRRRDPVAELFHTAASSTDSRRPAGSLSNPTSDDEASLSKDVQAGRPDDIAGLLDAMDARPSTLIL